MSYEYSFMSMSAGILGMGGPDPTMARTTVAITSYQFHSSYRTFYADGCRKTRSNPNGRAQRTAGAACARVHAD